MRVVAGSAQGPPLVAPAGRGHPPDERPGARGRSFNALAQPRRDRRRHRPRPVRRLRRARHRGAVAGRRRTARSSSRRPAAGRRHPQPTSTHRAHRSRHVVGARPSMRTSAGRPEPVDLALCDPPYAFDDWAEPPRAACAAAARGVRVGPASVDLGDGWDARQDQALWQYRGDVRPRRPGRHENVTDCPRCCTRGRSTRSTTATSRSSRPRRASSTASSWRPCCNPQKEPASSRLEDAPGHDRGVGGPPAQRQRGRHQFRAWWSTSRRGVRRRLHRQGPAGASRLRVGDADGPDEQDRLGHAHRVPARAASAHSFLASKSSARSPGGARRVVDLVPQPVADAARRRSAPDDRRLRRASDALDHATPRPLLRRAIDIIATARTIPLSSSPMINRDEILELLEEALNRLPDELRQARWMLKERDDFVDKTQPRGRRHPRRGTRPGRAHGAAHRGRAGRRAARPPHRRGGRDRRRQHAPRDRGLLRPAPGQLRDPARPPGKTVAAGREKLAIGAARRPPSPPERGRAQRGFFDQDR